MDNLEPLARAAVRRIDDEYGAWWAAVFLHALAEAQTAEDVLRPLSAMSGEVHDLKEAYGAKRRLQDER